MNNKMVEVSKLDLYPTRLMGFRYNQYKKMNMKIVKYLLKRRDEEPDNKPYSIGGDGWHSNYNLTDLDYDWSRELKEMILQVVADYSLEQCEILPNFKLETWAMVIPSGAYSNLHSHPGWFMSGVYYVKVPEELEKTALESGHGSISFPDTRAGACGTMHEAATFKIAPREGEGAVFPSWMPHYVTPYQGSPNDLRISISWNIIFDSKMNGGDVIAGEKTLNN